MKAHFVFNMKDSEDRDLFRLHNMAVEMSLAIDEIKDEFRRVRKYGELTQEQSEFFDEFDAKIMCLISDRIYEV